MPGEEDHGQEIEGGSGLSVKGLVSRAEESGITLCGMGVGANVMGVAGGVWSMDTGPVRGIPQSPWSHSAAFFGLEKPALPSLPSSVKASLVFLCLSEEKVISHLYSKSIFLFIFFFF